DNILLQYLENLKKHEIFAYAALDGDGGGSHLQGLDQKAVEGLLSAGYTVWEPDFESHNFSTKELALAARDLAREWRVDVDFTAEEIESLMREKNIPAGTAITRLGSRKHVYLNKGTDWGRALAKVACAEGAEVSEKIRNEKGERPALAILAMLIRGYNADYGLSAEHTISKHRDRG
ncbi:MAG: hypothetical protein ACR2OU_20200, partial [Thermomicrobiales bacterium]